MRQSLAWPTSAPRVTLDPGLDQFPSPDPPNCELSFRFGEVGVRLNDLMDPLARHPKHFCNLGNADQVLRHVRILERDLTSAKDNGYH